MRPSGRPRGRTTTMSPNDPDAETTVSRVHRFLHLLKLLATTLAALVGLATTLGVV